MNQITKLFPEDRALLETFAATPQVQAALAKQAAATVAERAELVRQLIDLETTAEKQAPAIHRAVAEAEAVCREAQIQLATANSALSQALAARSAANFQTSTKRAQITGELADGAHPAIAEFVDEMATELDRTRKQIATFSATTVHPITKAKTVEAGSNKAEVSRRIEAIHAAIDAAEALKLEPDQAGVPEALDGLRASLPAV